MLKLLIVDDEYYTCEGLKKAIDWAQYGIEVADTCGSAEEALNIVASQKTDIILTDIKMRDMDGLEMIEILRRDGFDGQIVVMSGYQYFEYAKRAIDSGVRKYLVKPLDFDELAGIMKQISDELSAAQPKYNIKQGKATEIIVDIMQYIDEHFSEEIQLSAFAAKHFRDVTYISKLFKEYTGMNYTDYLADKRIEKAKKLLTETGMAVEDIAAGVGYNDMAHFRKVFRSKTNMSPGQYRKENRK